jgi:diguanylate cyclase (GGDEF)-like protein
MSLIIIDRVWGFKIMKQKVFSIANMLYLDDLIHHHNILSDYENSSCTLIQIYDVNVISTIGLSIKFRFCSLFPNAVIVGASTVAQICNDNITTHNVVVGFTFFSKTHLSVIFKSCDGVDEYKVGVSIADEISKVEHVVAVMLLTTPLSLDLNRFMDGINHIHHEFIFFGGGAADYNAIGVTHISSGDKILEKGSIAVVFSSQHLRCKIYKSSGWQSLSKEMVVTDSDGVWIKKIDNENAFNVYSKYINIQNDDYFFQNAIDFPFIFNRDGEDYVRSPVDVNDAGEIKFLGDINSGETFKIGYGNPEIIINSMFNIKKNIEAFQPEALFVFACCCRYYLLQDNADLEIKPLNELAPIVGFYTYGEFMSDEGNVKLLNSTLILVAFKESETSSVLSSEEIKEPYFPLNKNVQIISRLVHFILRVSEELEHSNEALALLSKTDKLTGLNNRMFLDAELNKCITLSSTSERIMEKSFSLLLLDVDYFKRINDDYGHLIGDEVLVSLSNLIKNNLRPSDSIGRWGGEEFLIIIPESSFNIAMHVAEKVRQLVESYLFPSDLKLTCSIGVCNYQKNDTSHSIVSRVDRALYMAKNHGRNKVFFQ